MIQAIDNIGIAVRSLDAAIPRYEQMLGVKCSRIETVETQQVRTAFFEVGGSRIELLEATTETSPIARHIEKRGEGLHHVAFRTDALEADLQRATAGGCEHLSNLPTNGAHGSRVAFFHPRSLNGSLVELCQPSAASHSNLH